MRVAQLAKCDRLDLADALAGDAELDADLFERAVAAIFQPIAQLNDLALALGQLLQYLFDLLAQHRGSGGIGRRRDSVVLDEIAHATLALLAHRHLQREW